MLRAFVVLVLFASCVPPAVAQGPSEPASASASASAPAAAPGPRACPDAPIPACPPVPDAAVAALPRPSAETPSSPPRGRARRGRTDRGDEQSFDERPLSEAETAMAMALHRFACRAPQDPEAVSARYRHARLLYEANHFDEAAPLFRSIAMDHPSDPLAEHAANLYLDSLNVLGTRREGREACFATLVGELDPLAQLYCASPTARDAHPELCPVLHRIHCVASRSGAEGYAEDGRHESAARTYEAMLDEEPGCEPLDELLYNAALSRDAAHQPGRATALRERLLQRFPRSALAEPTLWTLATSEHAVGRYEEAATRYEAHATRYPGSDGSGCAEDQRTAGRCPDAPLALSNAIVLRLGLGDLDRATEDAALFERNYARSRREETASLTGSLVIALARGERWADVARLGDAWARHWLSRAPTELGLEVRRALAQATARQRSPRAAALFSVLADADLRSITDEVALARARDVVAEARIRVTDADTDAFLARRAPRADGAAWRAARDEELRALRARLERVAELEVPRRDVEAIARLARLEAHLARETADADLRTQATERYATCLAHATATRTFGETSSACFEGLAELAPDRFTAAHELTAGVRFVASVAALPRGVRADEGHAASR